MARRFYVKRRRARRSYRTRRAKVKSLKRYGQRLRRGLDTVISPVTTREFALPCRFNANTYYSNTVRLDPFGESGSGISSQPMSQDQRFVQMCALYDEFRILSWSVDIVCNGPSFNNPNGNVPTSLSDAGRMTFMCQLFRSHTNSTPGWTAQQMLKAPGTIVAKPRGSSSYPACKIQVFPTTLAEKTNWVSTKLTADGQVAQFYAGTLLPFSPCIDICSFSPKQVSSGYSALWTYSIICRYRVAFRKGLGLTSGASLNMVQDLQDRVEILKLDPKLSLDVNATIVKNCTAEEEDDADDHPDGVRDAVARNASEAARMKGERVEDADDIDDVFDEMNQRTVVKREPGSGQYSDHVEQNDGPHSIWGGVRKTAAGIGNAAAAAAAAAAGAAAAAVAARAANQRAAQQPIVRVKDEPKW